MGNEIRRTAKSHLLRRDVKSRKAFVLKFAMLNDRIVSGDEFADRVRDVRRAVQANVAFDQRYATFSLGDDQVARKGSRSGVAACGNEKQMNGLLQCHARRQVNESAVGEKGGVEGGESMLVKAGVLPEVLFEQSG